MGIAADLADDIAGDWHAALAALAWQVEAGADEPIVDAPVNRYELAAEAPKPVAANPAPQVAPAVMVQVDATAIARATAEAARSLDALRAALAVFDLSELNKGARNTVFPEAHPPPGSGGGERPPGRG